jgi:hypothetical protein
MPTLSALRRVSNEFRGGPRSTIQDISGTWSEHMNPTGGANLLVTVVGVAATIGAIDAAIRRKWDLSVLHMMIAGAVLALGLRLESRHPA